MPVRDMSRAVSHVRGGARWLAQTLATPLVPADYVDLVAPLRSPTTLRARVVAVHPETRDSATLVLQPGRGWHSHRPGQYVRLGVDIDGVRQWRSYSVTSRPRSDGCIAVTVKAIAGGLVSNHLVRRTASGEVVHLDQAAGEFVLPDPPPSRLLFVTAGSGITPVMGILRHALAALRDVVVVHSAPAAADAIFGEELRAMARGGRLRLLERHTATVGRLTVEQLTAAVPDFADRDVWACGPTGLLDALTSAWESRGIADRMHLERFRPTVVAAGEGGTVTFGTTGTTAVAAPGKPLLEVGEEAGVLMPFGCRMGICFGCVAPLREGAVRDLRTGEVTTASPGDGVAVQTCVSAAAGACHIDL